MVPVKTLSDLFQSAVAAWHTDGQPRTTDALQVHALTLHRHNYDIWHEEDQARRRDVADQTIVQVKRTIDRLNQLRNDSIEKIDRHLLDIIGGHANPDAPVNSETPGSIIDRLSIISLRLFHMEEETRRPDASGDHKVSCEKRLAVLREQHADLVTALTRLLNDLSDGKKRLKVYRQFKMYNDPALNPALYRTQNTQGPSQS
ncbi:MAG: hypothetical protein A2268_11630 [Candidatus Raymondbacteria bacterium RifOxyA12_full_50_37]|uniref:DUF4254 domain-containing protein n=1 Tax=Candidatus Raymondbacteria bacterium RIFOXYD12_FULL_49_13 TaxID=1817890 RepID=A0A1F7F3Q4_UNCRA|nr:MAG: hypothetical protein A2268_11630 [Candidatus Raymondbacteria bacterium RifOxyA12_full_50_37]OGJ85988.1 MAG: hypothetical protein A2248_00465 [Candidatus Raymondbacteria bacterium RIFOXYA2_FULL_49_16]OGJ97130.1 MAG: hypothetical protein A2453_12455 [Candidatus Raymondbacteria bacterium RIFOXYC2_FULL_50_21]OGK01167.1 MAG: hypothetical protein A2519_01440 [Candidatus Raymondbacteria bacterium RIFOXYD12_FULL_49_13]OGK05562.1 MAG: hypothetical protein A2487_17115 [Candidatus Raymondbacteria 